MSEEIKVIGSSYLIAKVRGFVKVPGKIRSSERASFNGFSFPTLSLAFFSSLSLAAFFLSLFRRHERRQTCSPRDARRRENSSRNFFLIFDPCIFSFLSLSTVGPFFVPLPAVLELTCDTASRAVDPSNRRAAPQRKVGATDP